MKFLFLKIAAAIAVFTLFFLIGNKTFANNQIIDSDDSLVTAGIDSSKTNALPLPEPRGIYKRTIAKTKEIVPYENVREADAFWQKRIWRIIDVREKMNLPFKCMRRFPTETFFNILHQAATNEAVIAYEDDDFTKPIPLVKLKLLGTKVDTIPIIDPLTGDVLGYKPVRTELNQENINQFRIMEDWVFDEESSTMKTRIIGIAPILDLEVGGQTIKMPMYWIYYPDARKVLAQHEVFNPKNDAIRMTWEDVMEMRYFSSTITKESNVYDRTIASYTNGIDALLEAEKIKTELFNFEHDVWSY
jgi:gliding motility associated protien GldN